RTRRQNQADSEPLPPSNAPEKNTSVPVGGSQGVTISTEGHCINRSCGLLKWVERGAEGLVARSVPQVDGAVLTAGCKDATVDTESHAIYGSHTPAGDEVLAERRRALG